MDVRQLRYFLAIVKCGSFSRASQELNVAQPALSHHMANLEAELGVRLLDRSTKGVLPTECGETLMAHAETIIRQFAQAVRDVQGTSEQPSGLVSIGLPTSISLALTVPLIAAVENLYPAIELKISENHSGYLAEWVQSGRIDLAILFDIDANAGFLSKRLLTEALYFVSTPGTFPERQAALEFSELSDRPLVLTGSNHGLRHVIDRYALANSIDIRVKTELDSLGAIKQLVAAGFGNSILPWCAIKEECDQGRLQALCIKNPSLERDVFLVSSRDWPRTRAAELIADLVVTLAEQLIATDEWRRA
jgi:LysR family nitrogen assimilation transcriptional regulator